LNTFYDAVNAVAQLAEALPYKPKGRGFDSRWRHWKLFIDYYYLHVPIFSKYGCVNILEASGHIQACNGIALTYMMHERNTNHATVKYIL
jgi:hypothetical protein